MASNARMLLDPKSVKAASKSKESKDATSSPQDASAGKSRSTASTSLPILPLSSVSRNPSTAYDPRSLLNPRASNSASRVPKANPLDLQRRKQDDSTVTKADKSPFEAGPSRGGLRSMLESVHGVEDRAASPRKKVKLDVQDDMQQFRKTNGFTQRRSNGIVGEYMRPDPEKVAEVTKKAMVDLTNDDADADEEIQIVSSRSVDDQEVCYGHIATNVHAFLVPKPRTEALFHKENNWPSIKCTFERKPSNDTVINVRDPFDTVFAKVNPDFAAALAPAMDAWKELRTQVRLYNRTKKPNEQPHRPCSDQLRATVNIYGRRGDVDRVGRFFGQHNFWFRAPMASDNGIPIMNPHVNKKPLFMSSRSPGQPKPLPDTRTVEEATEAVSKLFDSLANEARQLDETDPPSSIVASPLLSHQKQALTFLLKKEMPRTFGKEESENSSLWRQKHRSNGAVYYHDVVAGLSVTNEPEQVLGGLLADVMGLGKTLEALALVATTIQAARQFSDEQVVRNGESTEPMILANSAATLVICPMSTVKNWEDQIAQHIKPDTLKYYVYHGPNREKNPYMLSKYDIVITTYGIVATEMSPKTGTGTSILRQLKWFRIVLDEAHTIREPKAMQTQAICVLEAKNRWCLTGTPIQNRLDDLGSLTRFLRLYPYDETGRFNRYIRGPAMAGNDAFLKTLRVFVDSFTLRRQRDRIDLPERKDLVAHLEFSAEERRLHDFFKGFTHTQIQELRQTQTKNSGVQHHVLRGIMTLRLICAHGRELLNEKDLERLKGISANEAIDLDDEAAPTPTISRRAAYESLNLRMEAELDTCRQCERSISKDLVGKSEAEGDDGSGLKCFILPCFDLLCADCFGPEKASFDGTSDKEPVTCPFCSATICSQYVGFSGSTAREILIAPDDTLAAQEEDSGDAAGAKHSAYSGPATKTATLLKTIARMNEESRTTVEAAGEAPLKCVVFSEFTSHLDLIERALTDHGHTFVRIDGTMSLPKRKKAMDALATDDSVKILLASIKAAGQGLNLTSASRAFIMEPMWNPAAEAQAVDRIYRLGQRRPVQIMKLRIKDSIEDQIVKLQKRKQRLADLSVNQNYKQLSKKELREQYMNEILELFR